MKVYVLLADAVTDASGEMLCGGGLIGVYATRSLAEEALANTWSRFDTWMRSRRDYNIEEAEVLE